MYAGDRQKDDRQKEYKRIIAIEFGLSVNAVVAVAIKECSFWFLQWKGKSGILFTEELSIELISEFI